jgi:hypothetical protein
MKASYILAGRLIAFAGLMLIAVLNATSGHTNYAVLIAVFAVVTLALPLRRRPKTSALYLRNYAIGAAVMTFVSLGLAVGILAAIETPRDVPRGLFAAAACVGFAYLTIQVGLMARRVGAADNDPPRSDVTQ